MNQTNLLNSLIIICCCALCINCQNPKQTKPRVTKNYYYVDQVNFQFKQSELLSCLNMNNTDTCGCGTRYLENGSPAPEKRPFEGVIETETAVEEHRCCDCIKTAARICPDGVPPCGPCSIAQCRCPEAEVIAGDSISTKFTPITGSPDDEKVGQIPPPVQLKITPFKLKDTEFYRYEFPKDFTAKVIMWYKGRAIAQMSVQNGQISDPELPPCK